MSEVRMKHSEIETELNYLFSCAKGIFKTEKHINFSLCYPLFKRNRVSNILYRGLKNTDNQVYNYYRSDFLACVIKERKQDYYFKRIITTMNEQGIEVIAFKGIVIKNLYYSKEMRVLGDIDFIVNKDKMKKALHLLIHSLDFKIVSEDLSEYVLINQDNIVIELHKSAMTKNVKQFDYFNNYENNLIEKEGFYTFSDDFHFQYFLCHAMKHLRDGELGLKYLVDFGLLIENDKLLVERNYERIVELKLKGILNILLLLSKKYFNIDISMYNKYITIEIDNMMIDGLTSLIIYGGEYGNKETQAISEFAKHGLVKTIVRKIFPPFTVFSKSSKVPFYVIVLYPFFWIMNLFRVVFTRVIYIVKIFGVLSKNKKTTDVLKYLNE